MISGMQVVISEVSDCDLMIDWSGLGMLFLVVVVCEVESGSKFLSMVKVMSENIERDYRLFG